MRKIVALAVVAMLSLTMAFAVIGCSQKQSTEQTPATGESMQHDQMGSDSMMADSSMADSSMSGGSMGN